MIDADHPTPASSVIWSDDLLGASLDFLLHITLNYMVLTELGQPAPFGLVSTATIPVGVGLSFTQHITIHHRTYEPAGGLFVCGW